ncbi:PIR Superfamily Protein [Plasmodium ovale curtisi]|uniref:PIR Superfamily Protein n=1 Tax=Plasmodium ovale curtisi TaxID=864141 RepID=A0A1A8XCK8_PLAOA|nr:PIR Superfamily Protein [Plasmodium ovale curtisi]
MKELGEKKIITFDMVNKFFLNNTNTNMAMAEMAAQKPTPKIKSACDSIFSNQQNSNFNSICKTLLSYFQLCKVTGSLSNPDGYCGYASYWLNGKVRKEKGESDSDTSMFFNVLNNSLTWDTDSSICKNYIYNIGDEVYKKMNILFTYYSDYNNFLIYKNTNPDVSCTHAQKCAKIYEENIVNCSIFEDEFCKKLKEFRDILMNQLISPSICAEQQDIIRSIDKTIPESSSQNHREESSQATTISASSFGTMMGVSLLSLFLYKVTPLGSWLSSRIGNLKKTLNMGDNEENVSLFQYSESTQSNYTNGDYNIAYHFVGNS